MSYFYGRTRTHTLIYDFPFGCAVVFSCKLEAVDITVLPSQLIFGKSHKKRNRNFLYIGVVMCGNGVHHNFIHHKRRHYYKNGGNCEQHRQQRRTPRRYLVVVIVLILLPLFLLFNIRLKGVTPSRRRSSRRSGGRRGFAATVFPGISGRVF